MESQYPALRSVETNKITNRKKELFLCLLLSIGFGIFVCAASSKILNRQDHRAESIEMERAILRGQPFHTAKGLTYIPPWQNRIMFPAFLELGIRVGILGPEGWYLALRFVFCIAMFATFWLALRIYARADFKIAGGGMLLLAFCLVATFNSPFAMTSDFPDVMFMAIFIVVSLRHMRVLLLILSIVAAANRESSVFAGVIWFFLYGADKNRKINFREAAYAAFVCICSYASVIALRYGFGGSQAIKSNTQFLPFRNNYYVIREFIHYPMPSSWAGLILCMVVPCVFWILVNRQFWDFVQKRLLWACLVIAAISMVFGNVGDPRIFIPSVTVAIFVAVWLETNSRMLSDKI